MALTYEEAVLEYARQYTGKPLIAARVKFDGTYWPGCDTCDWGAQLPGNYLVCVLEPGDEKRYKIYDIAGFLRELIKLSQEEI